MKLSKSNVTFYEVRKMLDIAINTGFSEAEAAAIKAQIDNLLRLLPNKKITIAIHDETAAVSISAMGEGWKTERQISGRIERQPAPTAQSEE